MIAATAVLSSVLVAAFGLTWAIKIRAERIGMLDVPNERSSHSSPTPRGGGLAIVLTVSVALVGATLTDQFAGIQALVIAAAGLAVAIVGYVDDRRGLGAVQRSIVHFVVAIPAVIAVGGLAQLTVCDSTLSLGLWGTAIAVVAVVWSTNLYNFMDGIDGIAACQAIFVTGAGALLGMWFGQKDSQTWVLLVVAAASAGFLILNWAPAKIFMGDVGSAYLGILIALLALWLANTGRLSVWVWLTLSALFVADATTTLLVRVFHGARWYSAHRSHVYQRLARRWESHSRVTLAYAAVNLFVLLPLGYWAAAVPAAAFVIAVMTVVILSGVALILGAGRAAE